MSGAASFLGGNLIERLRGRRGVFEPLVVDLRRPAYLPKEIPFYKIDLTDPAVDAALADILQRAGAEIFVHLAFFSSPRRQDAAAHEVEVIGTMNVLHACAEARVRKIVVKGTTMVYGALPTNPAYLTEAHPLRGNRRIPFIADKLEVEELVRRFSEKHPSTSVTLLRFATLLGPTVRNQMTRLLGLPVVPALLGFDPLFQLVQEEDALDALRLATEEDHPGVFNVTGRGVLPWSTILKLCGRMRLPLSHLAAYPAFDALWLAGLSPVPSSHLDYLRYPWVADGARAEEVLGFRPRYTTRQTVESFAGLARLVEAEVVA